MNIYQESILGQSRNVLLFKKAYSVSLEPDVLASPMFDRIQQICTALTALSAKQDRSGKALTEQKTQAMETVINYCVVCADFMISFGNFTNFSVFANIEGCSRSQLTHVRDEEVLKHVCKLLDVIEENPEQTTASGVNDELIENLNSALGEATQMVATPKDFRMAHRNITKSIDKLLNEYKDLVNNSLKSYMRSKYQESMPDLYNAFIQSLEVDAIPQRKRAVMGTFTNQAGESVRLVRVSVDGQKAVTKGGTKGGYFIPNMTAGQHELTFSRKGYQVEKRTVLIIPGETLELNIEFVPVEILESELVEA